MKKHGKDSITFKNDKYRKARGGYSRLLAIACESCGASLFRYQKDGPGHLKRVYIDRIISEKEGKSKKQLICPSCQKLLGTFYIYEKENRPAYRLYQNEVVKKIIKK